MIKEGLLKSEKIKTLCLIMFIVVFTQCSVQKIEYNIDDVKSIKATHSVKNKSLFKVYDTIISNKQFYNKTDDVIILFIEKKDKGIYEIGSTLTEFMLFKKNMPRYGKLKGHMFFNKLPVLLFGDITKELFQKLKDPKKGLLYYKREKGLPPLIYEPVYFNFKLENNDLESKGVSY